jgi:peptide/nickel transport system permease protein
MNQHSRALISGVLLLAFHAVVVLAGFFAPYNYATQDRLHPHAPPMSAHFFDCSGKFHFRPFVYGLKDKEGTFGQYERDCDSRYPVRFFARGDRYAIAGAFSLDVHLFTVDEPGRIFLLGTDGFGRDQFSRTLYGGQVSLFAGLLAAGICVAVGMLAGTLAGFYGGWLDATLMRLAELCIAIPALYLLLAVRSYLPLQVEPAAAFALVVLVIGSVTWGRPARLVRGVVLSARERNFVLAARGFGASSAYLIRRHLLPETLSVSLTQLAVLVPQFIMFEITLSFLGLGVGEPFPSWGNLLSQAQQYHNLVSYWWLLLPGLAPIPVLMAYYALSTALQRRLDLKGEEIIG